MNLSDLILGSGDDARKVVEQSNAPKKKTNYVRLKSGESIRGYILTSSFVAFMQHGDFARKIHSHVCSDPKSGKNCLSCKADVMRSKVWLVPIYDVEAKEVRIFEAKKKYMNAVYSFIDEYGDEATTTPISLSRSGSDAQSTTYTIMPTRVKPADKEAFVKPEVVIDDEFYMNILQPPADEYLRELLGLTESGEEVDITPLDKDGNEETGIF